MAFVRNNNNNPNNRRHNNNYSNNRPRHNNYGNNSAQGNPNSNGPRRHVNRINQVFESNGPEGRIRGTAAQIVEKYATMARDVGMSNDRVLSQNYLQHAEHYQRLLTEITEENAAFEKEREATRQTQQAQPEISGEAAAEGFVAGDQPVSGEQPRAERQERQEREPREPRPEQRERPQRMARPEQRHEQRERRPADDVPDNELPSFLHVPIKASKPPATITEEASVAVEQAEKPRAARVQRPRRVPASAAQSDDITGESIQAGPSDDE